MENTVFAKPKVYVVDDEAYLANSVSALLRNEGYDVSTFYDGSEIVEHVPEIPPVLMVTDFSMPKMDGMKLTRWMRTHYPECRVIMFSANLHLLPRKASGLPDHPHFMMLAKPLSPASLVAAVKAMTEDLYVQVKVG